MSLRRVGITVAILLASAAALYWLDSRFALDTDDAYITYRYARNIVHGEGFVYNSGERVLGTTTPLYTLLLASVAALGAEIPAAARLVNVGCAAAICALVFSWLARRTRSMLIGLLGALLLLTSSNFVLFSISGMETSFYLLLILLAFRLYDAGRLVPAALAAGLTVLARIDGAAVGTAMLVHYVAKHRRGPPWTVVVAYGLPVLAYSGLTWWYFGQILPQSMLAKHDQPLSPDRWRMLEFVFSYSTLALWPLVVAGVYRAAKPGAAAPGLVALALWAGIYVAAYSLYRIDLYLWYLSPLAFALAVLGAYGLHHLSVWLDERGWSQAPRSWGRVLVPLIAITPCLYVRAMDLRATAHDAILWTDTVERARSDAARYVVEHGEPRDVICTGAIGIVGWQTDAYIYDVMGLVTRSALGRPIPEALAVSGARWYISEVAARGSSYPRVPGFELVGTFNYGTGPTFLLYEKAGNTAATLARRELDFRLANGLTMKAARLDDHKLVIELVAERPVAKDYKFFVHVVPLRSAGGAALALYDSWPTPATSRMKPGVMYEQMILFGKRLPLEGATVQFGLFDESDAEFARLATADGRTEITLEYRPAIGGENK